jgi:quercetin dioxygenase-like cupin family protein
MSEIGHTPWGYSELIFDGAYRIKLLAFTKKGGESALRDSFAQETFVVTSGKFDIEVDGQLQRRCDPGVHVTLHPGSASRFRCVEPGVIMECSAGGEKPSQT